jgi:hypothetical protein
MVYYLMMDVDSGNLVDEFDTLDEAFAAVRDGFERFGQAGVDGLALSENDDDGGGRLLAIGDELLRLEQAASPARLAG